MGGRGGNKYKVNGKERKQSMDEGVNELTRGAVLEKHGNVTDQRATLLSGLLASNMSPT